MSRSLQDLKREAATYTGSKQFPLNFKTQNGDITIYQDPEKMKKGKSGLPVMDAKWYVETYYPELLDDYLEYRAAKVDQWKRIDAICQKTVNDYATGNGMATGGGINW